MIRTYTDHTLLWTAFQQGESQAEKQVFQQFFKPLCIYSERITGQLEPAEDIVAESFIKAWDRRQDFEALDNLKAFLYRVVRNASINFAVATRQHRQAHVQIAYVEGQQKEDEPALQREILRVELLQEIYEEMENLPGRCGQIFKQIFIHGRSTEEIAAELSINPQTVRTQKARAIQLIKTQLLKKNRISSLLLLMAILESW
jgi:RNA polymerase sigma-70 factor (family 1)